MESADGRRPHLPPPDHYPSEVERSHRPVVFYENDRLSLPGGRIPPHPGRVGRHPRQGNADCIWLEFQQTNDRAGGDMSFHNVAFDKGGVARSGTGRHPVRRPEIGQLGVVRQIDFCSKTL